MKRLLLVLVGGGGGSVLRYAITLAAVRLASPTFPFGTLIVNIVGCFFIGFVHGLAMMTARVSPEARLFLTTGVMGGLTTYSAFNYEMLALVEQGKPVQASAYACAMFVGCIGAGLLGTAGARTLAAAS